MEEGANTSVSKKRLIPEYLAQNKVVVKYLATKRNLSEKVETKISEDSNMNMNSPAKEKPNILYIRMKATN